MIRWLGLGGVVLVASLLALACSDDTTLEDLGDEVQATRLAEATIREHNRTTTPQPTATLVPTPTPEPVVFADLRVLTAEVRDIRSFVGFLDLRRAGSDSLTLGSLGDEDGNLAEGWLDACCESLRTSANETMSEAGDTVLMVQAFYSEEEPSQEHLELVLPVQSGLDELRGTLDSIPLAANTAAAQQLTSAALGMLNEMDAAIEELFICCGQTSATPTPSPSPTPSPEA